jgi:hypothetical protein
MCVPVVSRRTRCDPREPVPYGCECDELGGGYSYRLPSRILSSGRLRDSLAPTVEAVVDVAAAAAAAATVAADVEEEAWVRGRSPSSRDS